MGSLVSYLVPTKPGPLRQARHQRHCATRGRVEAEWLCKQLYKESRGEMVVQFPKKSRGISNFLKVVGEEWLTVNCSSRFLICKK